MLTDLAAPSARRPFWARPELAFVLVSIALASLSGWILQHGYLNEQALSLYEKILVLSGAHPAKLEYLGLVYPHLPAYLIWFVHVIPGLGTAAAPYLAGVLATGCALALWFKEQARTGPIFAALALLALCAHPVLLWVATTGTNDGLSLLIFYLVGTAIAAIGRDPSPQSFLALSGLIAVYFFADERASYVILSLLPLLPLFAPRTLLERAPLVLYLVVFTPFVLAFLAWAYLNWLYLGNPWHFLQSTDSAFLGAAGDAPFVPWLRDHGQQFWEPLLISAAMTLVSFPVLVWQIAVAFDSRRSTTTTAVLTGGLLLATALATFTDFLAHPLEMLFLMVGVVMVALNLHPPQKTRSRAAVLTLLLLGVLGGWGAVLWEPSPDMGHWLMALEGRQVPPTHQGGAALGNWLAINRQPTLLDDSLAYPAIVARGDTDGLILPYSDTFKLDLARQTPDVAQIAVPDPHRGKGATDLVNSRFKDLYDKGLPGFDLVYDHRGWRVYRAWDPSEH